MNESEFRRRFQEAIGAVPTPPDLAESVRRALDRPARPLRSRASEVLAIVASLILVAAVVGFGLTHRPTRGTSGVPASVVSSPPAPPSVDPSPAPTITPPVGDQPCTPDQLTLSPGWTRGAAGHTFVLVLLTNSGTVPCTLEGFPSAQIFDSQQAPVPARVVGQGGMLFNTPAPVRVLLIPGQTANFQASWGTVSAGTAGCPSVGLIQFGPPGQSPNAKLTLPVRSMVICTGELDESALAATPPPP